MSTSVVISTGIIVINYYLLPAISRDELPMSLSLCATQFFTRLWSSWGTYCLAIEKKKKLPPSLDPLPPSQFHSTGASSLVYALFVSEAWGCCWDSLLAWVCAHTCTHAPPTHTRRWPWLTNATKGFAVWGCSNQPDVLGEHLMAVNRGCGESPHKSNFLSRHSGLVSGIFPHKNPIRHIKKKQMTQTQYVKILVEVISRWLSEGTVCFVLWLLSLYF